MKKRYFDHSVLGLILGLVVPVITLFIFAQIQFPDKSFMEFYRYSRSVSVFAKVFSLSAMPNLLLFFVFIWTNNLRSARGVIGATIIWAVLMLIFKFF